MTQIDQETRVTYVYSSSVTRYNFEFYTRSAEYVVVEYYNGSDTLSRTRLIQGTDYTVTMNANNIGGYITLLVILPSMPLGIDTELCIFLFEPYENTNKPASFYNSAIIEKQDDNSVRLTQQNRDAIQDLWDSTQIMFGGGQIGDPSDVNRYPMIAIDGKAIFKGGKLKYFPTDGTNVEKNLSEVLFETPNLKATINIVSPYGDITVFTSTDLTALLAKITTLQLLDPNGVSFPTTITAKPGGTDTEFHLVASGDDTYVVQAKVVGNKSTLELIKDTDHSVKPIDPATPNAPVITIDKNHAKSASNLIDEILKFVFQNGKTVTFRDAGDAEFFMSTISGSSYKLKMILDPALSLNPSNAEQEFQITRNGTTIEVRLRQKTKWTGAVVQGHIPYTSDETLKELATSNLKQETDGIRPYISLQSGAYLAWKDTGGVLRLAISANPASSYKELAFNLPFAIQAGSVFMVNVINDTTLGVVLTPYYWDTANNRLTLPSDAGVRFTTSQGGTTFTAGGTADNIKLISSSPVEGDSLSYDAVLEAYVNKTPAGSAGALRPGTPWELDYVTTAKTATEVLTIPVRHAAGSLELVTPGAGIFYNAGTSQTPIFVKIGVIPGSTVDVEFNSSSFVDQGILRFDGATGTIKGDTTGSGGGGGGNGNAAENYYMVAGANNTPQSGFLKTDGSQTISEKPIRIDNAYLNFLEGSSETSIKPVARNGVKKLLLDVNLDALAVGLSSYAAFRRVDANTMILEIAEPKSQGIVISQPYPTVNSVALWQGHESTFDQPTIKASTIQQTGSRRSGVVHTHKVVQASSTLIEEVTEYLGEVTLDVNEFSDHRVSVITGITFWTNTSFPDGGRLIEIVFNATGAIAYPSWWKLAYPLPATGQSGTSFLLYADTMNGVTCVTMWDAPGTVSPNLKMAVYRPYPTTGSCLAVWVTANGKAIKANVNVPQTGNVLNRKHEHKVVQASSSKQEIIETIGNAITLDYIGYSSHIVVIEGDLLTWTVTPYTLNTTHFIEFVFNVTANLTFPSQCRCAFPLGGTYPAGTTFSLFIEFIDNTLWLLTYADLPVLKAVTTGVVVLPPVPTTGTYLAVFMAMTGRHINGIPAISQTGSVRNGVVHEHKVIQAGSVKEEVVTIDGSGVLTINVVKNGACCFRFSHDRDVVSFVIQRDVALNGKDLQIWICREGGTSSVFPRLAGYYAVNDGTIPFGNAYMDDFCITLLSTGEKIVDYIFNRNV